MSYISFQPSDHFNTKLYTGNGSTNAITGVGFQPDWTWIKGRGTTNAHMIFDAVRGVGEALNSNNSNAEATVATAFTTFGSDGFTVGNYSETNTNSENYVSWNWRAGTGQGSSNTDGTINTTYTSANTTSGFSISTYTGTGSNATVGHGLGQSPSVVMVKRLNDTSDWRIYFSALVPTMGNAQQLFLNRDAPADNDSQIWNNTAPTSSVFHVGTNAGSNASGGTYVAYCFAEKKGFSKFGSYTGNGNANGPFVYTGFKPAFVLVKNASAANNWFLQDSKRLGYNGANHLQKPNSNGADDTGTHIDMLSNGFRTIVSSANCNGSGNTMIYMAFAEEPFVASNGVPAVAR